MPGPRRLYLLTMGLVTFATGARILSGDEGQYPVATYRVTFALMPFTAWGWSFALVGLGMLTIVRSHRLAQTAFLAGAALWCAWAVSLWLQIPERAGVLQPTGYAALCVICAYALYVSTRSHEST